MKVAHESYFGGVYSNGHLRLRNINDRQRSIIFRIALSLRKYGKTVAITRIGQSVKSCIYHSTSACPKGMGLRPETFHIIYGFLDKLCQGTS